LVRVVLLALTLALLSRMALAQPVRTSQLVKQGKPGTVLVADGKSQVNVPDGFVFLDQEQSQKVLTSWGNPPDATVLGMLVPTSGHDNWGITISYESEGFVSDDDELDYDELLAQLKYETHEASKLAKANGFAGSELVGWATRPRYDPQTHTMHWAKEIRFENSQETVVNYDMRILGRHGVLVLQGFFYSSQLATLEPKILTVLSGVTFTEGHRYEDFAAGDRISVRGLSALVIAKPATKFVLLALLKNVKLLVLLFVAGAGALAKLLKKRRKKAKAKPQEFTATAAADARPAIDPYTAEAQAARASATAARPSTTGTPGLSSMVSATGTSTKPSPPSSAPASTPPGGTTTRRW
jgi:uncharacterized membrane-anchored protein